MPRGSRLQGDKHMENKPCFWTRPQWSCFAWTGIRWTTFPLQRLSREAQKPILGRRTPALPRLFRNPWRNTSSCSPPSSHCCSPSLPPNPLCLPVLYISRPPEFHWMSEPDCLSESTVRLIPLWYLFALASLLSLSLPPPPKDTKLASANPKPPNPSRRQRRNVTMRRMHPSAHTQAHCSCHTWFFFCPLRPTYGSLVRPCLTFHKPSSASLVSPSAPHPPQPHSGSEMSPHGGKRGAKFSLERGRRLHFFADEVSRWEPEGRAARFYTSSNRADTPPGDGGGKEQA